MPDDSRQRTLSKVLGTGWSWSAARPEVLWDAWAFAAMEAELALDAWLKAAHSLKAAAFAAYREALDREERAAAELQMRLTSNRAAA